ncbi:MAG: hypothetical protein NXI23_15345 [Bacteroidetes bacterium]|nr:hypothetical protein [Bacteroidota bacterium]MDF1867392.1 hypothetical protein [Saprospiraceae bacterium]
MKVKIFFVAVVFLSFMSCSSDEDFNQSEIEVWEMEIEQARAATANYLDFDVAWSEGRIDASGYVPNMGHHYLNPQLADETFELLKPEFILYVPDEEGNMQMVAIEYGIVPSDPENPGNPPEGYTGDEDEWHFNEMIGMWTLHVWLQLENPDGIFAAHNTAIGD